jgi:hypothetical protein
LLAAWVAVSAASSPASRIALRAFGLALIAAAAAASPAASISLLIAALASFSTVSFLFEEEPEESLFDDLARADLAMTSLPPYREKTLSRRNGSRMSREEPSIKNVKGTAAQKRRCPSTWSAAGDVAVRQRLELTNTPFRPPC